MALPALGVQLIVFGRKYKTDQQPEVVLDLAKGAGFDAVEHGIGVPADKMKDLLAKRGMKYVGAHIAIMGKPSVPDLIKYMHALGAVDVCNSCMLKLPPLTTQDYVEGIKVVNEVGRALKKEGLKLHYHNHDFEFAKLDGPKRGMEMLLDALDPDACDLCVDVAWVYRGGDDPIQFLRQHKDRIGYVHLKDHDGTDWCALGKGKVPIAAVVKELPAMPKVRWAVVEQDTTKIEPEESMRQSREYLRTLGF